MKEIRDILADIGIVVVVLVLALPLLYKGGYEPKNEPKSDTIYIRDTIRIVEPTPVKEEVVDEEVVKFPKAKSEIKDELKSELNIPIYNELESNGGLSNELSYDSARLINEVSKTEREDSVAVIVPISEKVYDDSLYRAVVRGYKPELVSIDIYNTTKYYPVVEKVKIKPKITISAGFYGGFGNNGASYGLGVMVGVPIWSW